MRKKSLYAGMPVLMLFMCLNAHAQNLQWKDVAPIFYQNCSYCHRTNGIAPFPMDNYTHVVDYSASIQYDLNVGKMPPWPPDTTYQRFVSERIISASDKAKILDWINQGMAAGDTTLAPPLPNYPDHMLAGTPDLVIKIPNFVSNANTQDAYNCFSIPTGLTSDKYIKAFEVVPGNRGIVHHALVLEDTTGTTTDDTSGACFTPEGQVFLGGYAPGAMPTIFPHGNQVKMGMLLKAHSNIVLQIHYPLGTAGKVDSTEVRFYFYPDNTTNIRQVYADAFLQNWSLNIPANTVDTFSAQYPTGSGVIPFDVSAFAIFPHMHLLGKSVEIYAKTAQGDTINLIRINNWSFDWQGFYTFKHIIKIPAGSKLYAHDVYDNTTNNPVNPNNPPQNVYAGVNTTDEMLYHSLQWLVYQPGDENIQLDSLINSPLSYVMSSPDIQKSTLTVYPNPFSDQLTLNYYLPADAKVSVKIYDVYGREVRILKDNFMERSGTHKVNWDGTSDTGEQLADGIYFCRMRTNNSTVVKKVLLVR